MKARLDFGAEIDIVSGPELEKGIDRLAGIWGELARGLKHMALPVLRGAVTAGGALTLGSLGEVDQGQGVICGPRQGFVWRVCRVSVFGLKAGETLNLYKGDADPTAFVCQITGAPGYVSSSRLCLLKPDDHLVVQGAGLTAAEQVTVSGEAIEAPAEQIFKVIGG